MHPSAQQRNEPGPANEPGRARLPEELPPSPLRESRDDQRAILERFTPAEQQKLLELRQLLSSLAYHIGKDFHMPVLLNEPGKGWHWNFDRNEVRIDPADLLGKPLDYNRFVVCHEGAHRRITRIEGKAKELWSRPGFAFLVNCIEDPRVNNYAIHSYPHLKTKMDVTYALSFDLERKGIEWAMAKLGFRPKSVEAGFEYIRAWLREVKDGNPSIGNDLPKKVRAVVADTLEAAAEAWRYYPTKHEADSSERKIRKYAERSLNILVEKVWPRYEELVNEDLKKGRLSKLMQDMAPSSKSSRDDRQPGNGQGTPSESGKGSIPKNLERRLTEEEKKELEKALSGAAGNKPDPDTLSDELQQKIRDHIDSLPEAEKKSLEDEVKKAFAEMEEEINRALEGALERAENESRKSGKGNDPKPKQEPKKDWSVSSADGDGLARYKEHIATLLKRDRLPFDNVVMNDHVLIRKLEGRLKTELYRRKSSGYDTGFGSGDRIRIGRRISEVAKGVTPAASRAWQRKVEPLEFDYGFQLLLDLSSSMEGQNIRQAFRGAVVIAEALRRTDIPFEVLGFNSSLHEFKAFSQKVDEKVREKMGGIVSSTGSCTDLGWAIDESAKRLSAHTAKDKVMVVLTDGEPYTSSGHGGARYAVPAVIERVLADPSVRVIVVGLGLNERTLRRHFPEHVPAIASVTAEELPSVFARIVQDAVRARHKK